MLLHPLSSLELRSANGVPVREGLGKHGNVWTAVPAAAKLIDSNVWTAVPAAAKLVDSNVWTGGRSNV